MLDQSGNLFIVWKDVHPAGVSSLDEQQREAEHTPIFLRDRWTGHINREDRGYMASVHQLLDNQG